MAHSFQRGRPPKVGLMCRNGNVTRDVTWKNCGKGISDGVVGVLCPHLLCLAGGCGCNILRVVTISASNGSSFVAGVSLKRR